jgi:exopolysaccharide production protein ExoY
MIQEKPVGVAKAWRARCTQVMLSSRETSDQGRQRAGKDPRNPGKVMINADTTKVGHQKYSHLLSPPEDPSLPPVPLWKRLIDVVAVLAGLPLVVLVAIIICLWIKTVSPGPVLYKQQRIGRGGRLFYLYKFRTMILNADEKIHETHVKQLVESGLPMIKLDDNRDSRLIRGARMIRKTGLDEIPQIYNILKGEMSVAGPRPCLPCEMKYYQPKYLKRFSVPPGLTGVWQISRKPSTTFNEMITMDEQYIEKMSLLEDLWIMFLTPCALGRQIGESRYPHVNKKGLHVDISQDLLADGRFDYNNK